MQRRSFVSGRALVPSSGSSPLTDPWTGEILGEQLLAGPAAVEQALEAAMSARAATAALAPYQRHDILAAMAAGVQRRSAELVHAIVSEAGKPLQYAQGEVSRCVDTLTLAAEEARRPEGELLALDAVAAGAGRTGLVRRFPAGVVVGITPFNFPLNLVAHKVAPAIAAGCPFIIKPAPAAPTPALILAELAVEAGWPADASHVLLLDNSLAQLLVEDDRPAVLSFTGSDVVGWRLKALAGRKRVLLELGGSAAVLVHRDADLEHVVRRVTVGGYAYAGQVCISVQRVLVHRDVHAELRERLVAAVEQDVPWGDPRQAHTVSGPLLDPLAADRVEDWLREAVERGARILAGGGRAGPRLIAPALVEGVDHDLPLYRRELFGPGIVLERFEDLDQGIAMVNDSPWGLQAGVFTGELSALFRCHQELEVGAIIHDDVPTFRVDHMPYGGVKHSGLGREGLRYAIAEYTEPRLLALRA